MSEPAEKTEDIRNIQPDRLIKYRISEDKFSAEVLLPGLWYTDFDKKIGGKVSLWSLIQLFEGAGYLIFSIARLNTAYYGSGKGKRSTTFYTVASEGTFSKEVHNIRYSNSFGPKRPLKFEYRVLHLGPSSVTYHLIMTDSYTDMWLGKMKVKFILLGEKSRNVSSLPSGLQEEQKRKREDKTIRKQTNIVIPANALRYKTRAAYSDTDHNLHVNQCVYIRWCTDAATKFATEGHFRDFKANIGLYPIAEMEFQYLGESVANDELEVHTWQDLEVERTLRFVITKDDKPVVKARFSFHKLEKAEQAKL